jgi:hypothetical protein
MNKYEQKLKKTCDIIDTCFALKTAYIKSIHPEYSEKKIREEIFNSILDRKEKQWKSQII